MNFSWVISVEIIWLISKENDKLWHSIENFSWFHGKKQLISLVIVREWDKVWDKWDFWFWNCTFENTCLRKLLLYPSLKKWKIYIWKLYRLFAYLKNAINVKWLEWHWNWLYIKSIKSIIRNADFHTYIIFMQE